VWNQRVVGSLSAMVLIAATACSQPSATPTETPTPASTVSAPSSVPAGYAATSVLIEETRGTNTVKVNLPQVAGGSAAVRDRFNTGMRTALEDLFHPLADTSINDGSLMGDERSRVTTITEHIVGGVAIFNWYGRGAAHPNNSVATIVIDADTAHPVLLTDLWTDPQAAAERLSTLVPEIDDRVNPLTPPALDTFLNWVPTPQGFHTYVPVAHALGDYLPVTVPWDRISELLTPQMRAALVG
jgi:hypothetical protein